MGVTGVGGGVMLALAAALWLVYFVPNWFRRSHYLATERNAVRLQQTIRVLAETSELPDAVRNDLTLRQLAANASRSSEFAQRQWEQKQLPQSRLSDAPDTGPVAVGPVLAPQSAVRYAHSASARRRRSRTVAALVLLTSAVVAVAQGVVMIVGGATMASWLVFSAAVLLGGLTFAALGRLARAGRSATAATRPVARRIAMSEPLESRPEVQRDGTWTPVPVPTPLYLSREQLASRVTASQIEARRITSIERPEVAAAQARAAEVRLAASRVVAERTEVSVRATTHALSEGQNSFGAATVRGGDPSAVAAARELEHAAGVAEQALRDAYRGADDATAPEPQVDAGQISAAPSRFARMGIVDDTAAATPNVDAMMARRRRAS